MEAIVAPIMNESSRAIEKLVNGMNRVDNKIITIEELSELQKELTKNLRDKGDKEHLIEEMVDVLICMQIIMQLEDISQDDIIQEYIKKMMRNLKRLKGE